MKVVYGHTDSIYVQIDNVEKAQKVIKVIENEVERSSRMFSDLNNIPLSWSLRSIIQHWVSVLQKTETLE